MRIEIESCDTGYSISEFCEENNYKNMGI